MDGWVVGWVGGWVDGGGAGGWMGGWFVCFDSLRPINNLSVKQGLPGLNQY